VTYTRRRALPSRSLLALVVGSLAMTAVVGQALAAPPIIDVENEPVSRPLSERCLPISRPLGNGLVPRPVPDACPWWPESPTPMPIPHPGEIDSPNE
jgi:hypothetical protein